MGREHDGLMAIIDTLKFRNILVDGASRKRRRRSSS